MPFSPFTTLTQVNLDVSGNRIFPLVANNKFVNSLQRLFINLLPRFKKILVFSMPHFYTNTQGHDHEATIKVIITRHATDLKSDYQGEA